MCCVLKNVVVLVVGIAVGLLVAHREDQPVPPAAPLGPVLTVQVEVPPPPVVGGITWAVGYQTRRPVTAGLGYSR